MEKEKGSWFKEHADTIAIITILLAGFYWADGKFDKVNDRLVSVEKDVTAIKTIMIMKNFMPQEMCKVDAKETEKK